MRRDDATTSEDAARRGAEISRIDFVVIRFDSFERRARSRVLRDRDGATVGASVGDWTSRRRRIRRRRIRASSGFVVVGVARGRTTLMSSSALRGIPIPTVPPSNGALMATTSYTRSSAITRSLNRVAFPVSCTIISCSRYAEAMESSVSSGLASSKSSIVRSPATSTISSASVLPTTSASDSSSKRFDEVVVDGGVVPRGVLGPKVERAIFYTARPSQLMRSMRA